MLTYKNNSKPAKTALIATMFAGGVCIASNVAACSPNYTVQAGDTLFTIAEANLGDMTKWSLIFYNNPQLAGGSIVEVPAGTELAIPCPEGTAVITPDPTPLQTENAELKLVTASDNAPFVDLSWPGRGMLPELVNAVMEVTPQPVTYSISWDEDWKNGLDQTSSGVQFDMGFPRFKPDCDGEPSNKLCTDFHFSEPLVDLVNLLFVRSDSDLIYNSESDIEGRTLCRPAGQFTHDLNGPGREWLTKNLIELEQPKTVDACFEMLLNKDIDAVAVNEFQGVEAMYKLGLADQVAPLARPLSVEGLHVVISKKHWRGTTHLFRFNAGLAALKETERYDEIVSRHLTLFLGEIQK